MSPWIGAAANCRIARSNIRKSIFMTTSGPHSFLHRHALGLALLAAPFMLADRAEAACAPATGNNVTVTCSDTTTSSGIGYGTGLETGNTINVLSGASVKAAFGIDIKTATLNNAGVVSGSTVGIDAQTIAVSNSGTITGTAGQGIFASNAATVTNSGSISGVNAKASRSRITLT